MGKAKRKAEKAAKSVLGVGAVKELKAQKKKQERKEDSQNRPGDVNRSIQPAAQRTEPPWRNKEKPLLLCARGITYRYRHLMTDIMQLIPHYKTDSKLDTKHDWNVINEVAELKGATSVLFFEARKKKDLYIWASKVPCGPCARFLCSNVHTMAELKLSGNHLKGSRPVLSFDAAFDEQPQLQVMKELLQQMFTTPKGHPKSKPFFDHVISFCWCDNRIWIRNYQVIVALDKKQVKQEGVTLVEVGPRLTLQPIKVFAGSFRGKVLFENPEFIHPNAVRAHEKRKAAGVYDQKKSRKEASKAHKAENQVGEGELSNKVVFAGKDSSDEDGEPPEGIDFGEAGDGDDGGSEGEEDSEMDDDDPSDAE